MRPRLCLLAAMLVSAMPVAAAAQNSVQSAPHGQNKDQPIHIEAATLEVHDKAKTATFSGNVQVVQGDTTMRCRSLVVFYGAEESAGAKPVVATRPASDGPATPGMP